LARNLSAPGTFDEALYRQIVSYADWLEGQGKQTATELAAREFMLANRKIGAAVFDVWWHEHYRRVGA
jgi:hypothetical protein